MQMSVEFSSVFLKLINKLHSYLITDIHFVSTFTQKKMKLVKKTPQKYPFSNALQTGVM